MTIESSKAAQARGRIRLGMVGGGEGAKADRGVNFPTIDDGVLGMRFIEAAVASSAKGARWVRMR